MDKIKEQWIGRNITLQKYAKEYYLSKNKERERAAQAIQQELNWPPFLNYVYKKYPGADPFGTIRHGLDFETERAIAEIDGIARGEQEFPDC